MNKGEFTRILTKQRKSLGTRLDLRCCFPCQNTGELRLTGLELGEGESFRREALGLNAARKSRKGRQHGRLRPTFASTAREAEWSCAEQALQGINPIPGWGGGRIGVRSLPREHRRTTMHEVGWAARGGLAVKPSRLWHIVDTRSGRQGRKGCRGGEHSRVYRCCSCPAPYR